MKVCDKCGTPQSDDRSFCVDCGEKLGHSITKKMYDEMCNENYRIYVSVADKVTGIIACAGTLAAIIIAIIFKTNIKQCIISILCFAFCLVEAFLPNMLWNLEKMRLENDLNNAENVTPSDFYLIGRKIAIYLFFISGVIALVGEIIL